MKKHAPSEKGQVLILIVLAIVALFGFASLAIDGGMIYSERRKAQNAADSAAYAAASNVAQRIKNLDNIHWDCSKIFTDNSNWVDAKDEARDRASNNAFVIDNSGAHISSSTGKRIAAYGMDDKNGIEFVCVEGSKDYINVRVQLTSSVKTSFLHFVNSGEMVNTVDAIVQIRPRTLLGDGATIVALKNTCGNIGDDKYDGGVTFRGSTDIDIVGGGIKSNACLRFLGEGGTMDVTGGTITWDSSYGDYTTAVKDNGSQPISPAPQPGDDIVVDETVTLFTTLLRDRCATLSHKGNIKNNGTFSEGRYTDIDLKNNESVTLKPGLYCVEGDFNVTSGSVSGDGVTIFMDTTAGHFNTQGNGTKTPNLILKAPLASCGTDNCGNVIGGLLLLYLGDDLKTAYKGQAPEVKLGGSSSTIYEGTILVPFTRVTVGGTSDLLSEVGAQIVAETIEVHGGAGIKIKYDSKVTVSFPSSMNLHK